MTVPISPTVCAEWRYDGDVRPADDDTDRAAILARRRRWIALAVAGVASTTQACSCSCLAPPWDSGRFYDGGPDAGMDGGTRAPTDGAADTASDTGLDAASDVGASTADDADAP
jgi:hypothetical protein